MGAEGLRCQQLLKNDPPLFCCPVWEEMMMGARQENTERGVCVGGGQAGANNNWAKLNNES